MKLGLESGARVGHQAAPIVCVRGQQTQPTCVVQQQRWSVLVARTIFRHSSSFCDQFSHAFPLCGRRKVSYMGQEPRPRNCEGPKESVQRPSHDTSKIMSCGHRSSSVMWPDSQPNVIQTVLYSCGVPTRDRILYISSCEIMECHGLPVSC